jgi:deazaflavin-dependent oxidoreductase (nitroreductase family)
MAQYKRPDWFTVNVANRLIALLTALGLSVRGSRVLVVPGRRSGLPRRTPVNLLELDGQRYLVAPRGETEWARNLRASGRGELHLGSKVEPIRVAELSDDQKPPVLRAYLRLWKSEAGSFFAVSGPDAGEAELRQIAPQHPVFQIAG